MRGVHVFRELGSEPWMGWPGAPPVMASCLQPSAQGGGLLPVPGASPHRDPVQDHPALLREAVQHQRPTVWLVSGGAGGELKYATSLEPGEMLQP